MRVLVTGGAGFIGSHLLKHLSGGNHKVVVYDNLTAGRVGTNSVRGGTEFILGDVRDDVRLTQVFNDLKPEIVFHLAAIHFIPACESNPAEAISVNVAGTANVSKACQEYPPAKLVFASSAAVYQPSARPHRESDPLGPIDVYGVTKCAGEQLVQLLSRRTAVSCVIARLFNVYGPNETNPHVIPDITAQVQSGKPAIALGDLEPVRDYVAAKDVARALINLSTLNEGSLLTTNVGTGRGTAVSGLVEIIQRNWPSPFKVLQDESRLRKVDRPCLVADVSGLRGLIGWVPESSLENELAALLKAP
ncbi:MAG: NAD(P)-dependent oxidoreductase [Chloroflexi bacterium]|nr:NAD(P)-dependent oxidoreductase [Chloroflexota bacterium]